MHPICTYEQKQLFSCLRYVGEVFVVTKQVNGNEQLTQILGGNGERVSNALPSCENLSWLEFSGSTKRGFIASSVLDNSG